MNINELDIINLPYPMFPVTEEEKEILRRAELSYFDEHIGFVALCGVLHGLGYYNTPLNDKVEFSLKNNAFLTQHLGFSFEESNQLDQQVRQLFRRVWITKLINQDVDV